MSAPETHTDKEVKAHRPVIKILLGGMAFAAVLLVALVLWLASQGQEPRDVETQIDSRTGERVPAD